MWQDDAFFKKKRPKPRGTKRVFRVPREAPAFQLDSWCRECSNENERERRRRAALAAHKEATK
jgi:hypothetical protein